MKTIATALVQARRKFGPALKDKTNPAFRSKYADLGACFEAVDAPCLEYGIAIYQETSLDETGVTVETVFLHESGESLRCGKLHVPAAKHDPQGLGSALTYARRYSLLTACGIAPEDDDGNAATQATRNNPTAPSVKVPQVESKKPWFPDSPNPSPLVPPTAPSKAPDTEQPKFIGSAHAELLDTGRAAALNGTKALTDWWTSLNADQQKSVSTSFLSLKKAARQADGG